MSGTKNGATRCDGCGRLSNAMSGYYAKPDGTTGHILPASHYTEESVKNSADFCTDCGNDASKLQNAQDAVANARRRLALDELTRIGEETKDEATDLAYVAGLNKGEA